MASSLAVIPFLLVLVGNEVVVVTLTSSFVGVVVKQTSRGNSFSFITVSMKSFMMGSRAENLSSIGIVILWKCVCMREDISILFSKM